jgi:hypothetical protein
MIVGSVSFWPRLKTPSRRAEFFSINSNTAWLDMSMEEALKIRVNLFCYDYILVHECDFELSVSLHPCSVMMHLAGNYA